MKRYKFNEMGEVTNLKPVVSQFDFRAYPIDEIKDRDGNTIKVQLCCELIGGRWEYFISYPR
jgi:hypothetical protein